MRPALEPRYGCCHDAHNLNLVDHVEVEDPYPDGDFDHTYAVVHAGCTALLSQIRAKHGL